MMRSVCTPIVAAGLFVLTACPAFAQPGPGGFLRMMQDPNTVMLLRSDKVRDELKLTDDQKADLKKVADKYGDDIRSAFTSGDTKKAQELMKSASDEADKVLKPDQTKRLSQLKTQAGGLKAFAKDDIASALKLTDKEKKDIAGQQEELERDAMGLFKDAQGDQDKMRDAFKKFMTMRQEAVDKVVNGLTDDQKKTWKELTGDKFDLDFGPPRRPANDR